MTDKIKKLISDNEIEFVDVRFTDIVGIQQHFTIPVHQFLDKDGTPNKLAFDGSSVKGFQVINESDLVLIPDLDTALVDPFFELPTLDVVYDIVTPIDFKPYSRDPRYIAKKTEDYLKTTGIADTAFLAPEAEFYIFDEVRFGSDASGAFYKVDSIEAPWNKHIEEDEKNLGYKLDLKGGYFPVPPHDHFQDLRNEITKNLLNAGLDVERAHHEVGAPSQHEINYKYNTLVLAADDLLTFKYIVKNTAFQFGYSATFMPKPVLGDNGSGMHTHQSLWKNGKPLFYKEGAYANLSQEALWYIGGLLKHADVLCAFTNPSTNSYHRLVPGFEAPTNLVYSARNRSAAIRIPIGDQSPAGTRLEFRVPDPSSNPYLAFSAQVLAGLDGIKNKIDPGKPSDTNIFALSPKQAAKIPQVPGSLNEAIANLQDKRKSEFLRQGDVFTEDLIDAWIDQKTSEIDEFRLRPHPFEFDLYYGI